jgi:hypothetical protein
LPDSPPSRQVGRPGLGAKLSLDDLARVRQALALLSEDPVAAAAPPTGDPDGPVPSSGTAHEQAGEDAAVSEDETDTRPLPVVLPGTTTPDPDAVDAPRGPFEPARPRQQSGIAESGPMENGAGPAEPAESLPPAAAAKLDQIKDLLLTAEAIGEQNLDKHFDQVSQRQRELIREFFNEAAPGRDEPA